MSDQQVTEDLTYHEWPSDGRPLTMRMKALSRMAYASIVLRAELAAIVSMRATGRVTMTEVWQILLDLHHYGSGIRSTDTDNLLTKQPLKEREEVWNNLGRLVGGESIPVLSRPCDEEQYEDWYNQQAELHAQWTRDVMALLENQRNMAYVNGYAVADHLPQQLVDEIEHRASRRWFGSGISLGVSLESQPISGFGHDAIIWLTEGLTNALLAHLDAYESDNVAQRDPVSPLRQVHFWWMVLKGFTYSAVHAHTGQLTVAWLAKFPEITERLERVLAEGVAVLNDGHQGSYDKASTWVAVNEDDEPVIQLPTAELIEKLRARIAEQKAMSEALRNLR